MADKSKKIKQADSQKVQSGAGKVIGTRPSKSFKMIKAIKNNKLYKKGAKRANEAKSILENELSTSSKKILPGQLVMFKYFKPKTKDQLEYYDAYPMTIFFNVINTSQGKRVLGFNLHYLPPQRRFLVMDKIFEMYRPIYTKNYEKNQPKAIDAFDYSYLMEQLERNHLEFCVREYIPALINEVRQIPPMKWDTAAFTEGLFKKQTQRQIMNHWRNLFKRRGT